MSYKVVLITGDYPPMRCGVGDYTSCLGEELSRLNAEVSIITTCDAGVIDVIKRASGNNKGLSVLPIMRQWNFREGFFLIERIKSISPDIVHIQYPTRTYGWRVMVNLLPIFLRLFYNRGSVITTLHEFSIAHILRKISVMSLIFFSRKIIVPTVTEKRVITRTFPFLGSKIKVIPVGSNIKMYFTKELSRISTRQKFGIDEDEFLLSYFGFINKSKGIELLLEAVKNILAHGYKTKLLIIGELASDNKYHQAVKQLAEDLRITDKIIWSGFCKDEDASVYLGGSDLCVLPFTDGVSFRRGSFLAAITHCLPVVTTVGDELPDELKNRENVLLVKTGDVSGLTNAIGELLMSKELRHKLSKGAEDLASRFSWQMIALKTISVYEELYNEKNKSSANQ